MGTQTTQGIAFLRGNAASPEVFTAVGQITGMGDFGLERGQIDVTTLEDTTRQFNAAIKEGSEFTLNCQYDPASSQHSGLRTDQDTNVLRNFRITIPSSPVQTIDFAARVLSWKWTNIEVDQVMGLEVGLKVSGDITFS